MNKLTPHSDIEADNFIAAIDQYILSKLAHMHVVHAKGVMPVEKAAKQLKAYIQPLLCYEQEEQENATFTS